MKTLFIVFAVLVVALTFWLFAVHHPQSSTISDSIQRMPKGTLVFIVAGVTGNSGFWSTIIPRKATFASELQRGAGSDYQIYPYLWNGGYDHRSREAAAKQLAVLIDEKAAGFDRICLVGHSFGGDIALRAAGLCKTKIDMTVCIATPHTYLITQDPNRHRIYIPVYCTWESRKNTKTIINIYPGNDAPVVNRANEFKDFELSENDATALTGSWQEHLAFPRLPDDSFMELLFNPDKDISLAESLTVADQNVKIISFVAPGATFAEHTAIHSRRIGYEIGELIRDGPTPTRLAYIKSVIQPKDADSGEAVALESNQLWLRNHEQDFQHVGWRLNRITVDLDPRAIRVAKNLDRTLPSPFLTISVGNHLLYSYPIALHTLKATWNPNFILRNFETYRLSIDAHHDILNPTSLGNVLLTGADAEPFTEITANPAYGLYWSASLDWVDVHY